MFRFITIISVLIFFQSVLIAQIAGDDCENAIELKNVKDWCSKNGEFTTVGSTKSGYGVPDCWDASDNDIWFRFTAVATAVTVVVSGSGTDGTISDPLIQIYEDNGCFGTIYGTQCAADFNNSDAAELNEGALTIGQSYLLRVDAQNGSTGTFKLCIKNFFPPVEPGQDCSSAALLCDKSPFTIKYLSGAGQNPNETNSTCIHEEKQSTWFKWIAKNNGTLTFILTPNLLSDDLDFVVYELPGGINDCANRKNIRCNATFGGNYVSCGPKTGLSLLSTDLEEDLNCDKGEDGFVKFIDMVAGRAYALVVNNWSASGKGFAIEFGGTGEFEGPEPDFIFDPPTGLRCEDSIRIVNKTNYTLGTITEWNWTMGTGANPKTDKKKDPSKVFYDTYGMKSVVLSVKSDKGCIKTVVRDIWMEPCCDDIPVNERIKIKVESIKNPVCHGDSNGIVVISGLKGNPFYKYSIRDTNFRFNPVFKGLKAGKYKLYIVDTKGCRDSVVVDITNPEKLIADAGPDKTIELGLSTNLNGNYSPKNYIVKHYWTPNYNLRDSSDLRTEAYPYKTTKYTLNVVQDSTGCTAIDEMIVFVIANRQIRIPNIFTPNDDGYNDYFTAYNKKAAVEITELKIFDRWGELMWETKNIPLGDSRKGWNGTFKGVKVNPGVYVYLAKVRFLDDEIIPYAGDITVWR
ncbi:MAG: gliding motility-associated C-terminal domain-containing protein [Deltaproteobacteria bacterium]